MAQEVISQGKQIGVAKINKTEISRFRHTVSAFSQSITLKGLLEEDLPAYTGTYDQVEKFAGQWHSFKTEFALYPSHQFLNDNECGNPLDTAAIFTNHWLVQRGPLSTQFIKRALTYGKQFESSFHGCRYPN
jgi:hypothetical protein